MALYDDYFTNEDKPFAENLNDALLLSNVFDLTVPIEFPRMFSNSAWVDTNSPRKCGVAILTLKEGLPSGVSVSTDSATGGSTLTGTGTVKLTFYPNFNSFGKFKSMTWENTGTVKVNLKTTNGTTIASNIAKGVIENQSSELRTLQEIVIEIVMTNATLKSFEVVMENKQQTRYGADVGISDVTGLESRFTAQDNLINTKVDKITGKGLSANDFTDDYKDNLRYLSQYSTNHIDYYYNDIFNDYDVNNPLTAYKSGYTVLLNGIWKTIQSMQSTTETKLGSIPSRFAPPNDIRVLQLGKDKNTYILRINTDGEIFVSNYGTSSIVNIPANSPMYIHTSWLL